MKDRDEIDAQLSRVLDFFPRVDTKASGLFAVDSAILTIAALNVKPADLQLWYVGGPAVLTVIGLLASYFYLYRCNFPVTSGGEGSLIYFVEVQKRTEANYIEEYEDADEQRYRRDLLGQVWRNSQILCSKYKDVSAALRWTLAALLPFAVLLSTTAYVHSTMPVIKS